MKKIFGFTLSELVIALAIVGVIAAVTVPGVVGHYQKDSQALMIKKVYMNLQENLAKLQTEKIGQDLYNSTLGTSGTPANIADFFDNYYSVKRNCANNLQPCFESQYKSLNKTSSNFRTSNIGGNCYSVQLADGTAMCIIPAVKDEEQPAIVYVDVNGSEKPNIGGRDMFKLFIYEDFSVDVVPPSVIADGTASTARETKFNDECRASAFGSGCFGKILNDDWKMNY